jgi:YHS domain-containing protein
VELFKRFIARINGLHGLSYKGQTNSIFFAFLKSEKTNLIMNRLFIVILALTVFVAVGQSEEQRRKNFNVKKNIALEGYDPVSFFSDQPEEGDEDIAYTHKGITYYFVNTSNLAKFKAAPDKYEPAYGGWCAYAMGETGEKVKVDPETFKIVNGRIYLFYNFWGNNTVKDWNFQEKQLKAKADQNWKKIIP